MDVVSNCLEQHSVRPQRNWPIDKQRDRSTPAPTWLLRLRRKFVFGRAQVYPTFLRDHYYGFHFLHASKDFGAFPSATMAGVAAFLFASDVVQRMKVGSGLILFLLGVALIATNGHWLSDIIAGIYGGAMLGVAIRTAGRS